MAPPNDEPDLAAGRMSAIERFLQNLLAERPERRRSPGVAGYLCKKGVGEPDPRDPRWIVYRPEHFVRAEALLRGAALPTEPPPKTPPPRKSRARSQVAGTNLEDRVAVFALSEPWPAEMLYAVMRAADASRVPHDVIVLCQDIAALHSAREADWVHRQVGDRRALLLYRGGIANTGFAVRTSTAVLANSHAPVLAITNLDATGLLVAARLPRLESICVPSWDRLERYAYASRSKRARVIRLLDDATHCDVKRAWALVRTLPAELRISPSMLVAGDEA